MGPFAKAVYADDPYQADCPFCGAYTDIEGHLDCPVGPWVRLPAGLEIDALRERPAALLCLAIRMRSLALRAKIAGRWLWTDAAIKQEFVGLPGGPAVLAWYDQHGPWTLEDLVPVPLDEHPTDADASG